MSAESSVSAAEGDSPEVRPWLSIVSALYGVEDYLPEFIQSVEDQGRALSNVEVILVDDGSVDNSGKIADEWARRRPDLVRVVHQENAGQSAARNAGTQVARGEWITYPDPDDMLAPGFLASAQAFIGANPSVVLIAAHLMVFNEATGSSLDSHPLRYRFAPGDHVVDLDRVSDYFHLHWASSFLRLDEIRRLELEGDPRVRPVGEDGHFIGRYLLGQTRPLVGIADSVRYLYRKRANASSSIDTSKFMAERFVDPMRYGLLDLIAEARRIKGEVPRWLQTELIYELQWLFRPDLVSGGGSPNAQDLGVADEFHELVGRVLAAVPAEVVESYAATGIPEVIRVALARGYRGEPWHAPTVQFLEYDREERWVKLRYRYVGTVPDERIIVNGQQVYPNTAKRRRVDFAGRAVLWERMIWLPLKGRIRIELDGVRAPLSRSSGAVVTNEVRARDIDRIFGVRPRFARPGAARRTAADRLRQWWNKRFGSDARRRRHVKRVKWLANSWAVKHFFADAWVLMDRDRNSWDNAEHLFRHLRRKNREVNSWFVVRKGTPDWERLKKDGYRRVVSYGSFAWKLLVLNARFIVSSHADDYVLRPAEVEPYGGPRWKFVFLQHGVTHNDISRWLNAKPIRLWITATTAERDFVAGDDSPFVFTRREVIRTGFPRHDRLAQVARDAERHRDTILLMPTWRQYLVGKLASSGRDLVEGFLESEYALRWQELLSDERLRLAASGHNARIIFLPHPELTPYLADWALPEWVEVLSYSAADVQDLIARALVTVTDYSSVVFDAAAVRRPVIYYQFDRDRVFSGGHFLRRGYFDYERDGFGPVVADPEALVENIRAVLDAGVSSLYAERIERTFPRLDGKNCERVVSAIKRVESSMKWR